MKFAFHLNVFLLSKYWRIEKLITCKGLVQIKQIQTTKHIFHNRVYDLKSNKVNILGQFNTVKVAYKCNDRKCYQQLLQIEFKGSIDK